MSSLVGSMSAQERPARVGRVVPVAGLIWFGILLAVLYGPVLVLLVKQWLNDEDMGHGFFVPLLAGYIAWQSRDKLVARPFRPNYWGLLLVVWAGVQLVLATLGAELFLARTAFVLSIIGTVLFLGGTYALRVLAFPLALLFFMVPIPAIIYSRITLPLQMFASSIAEAVLNAVGIPVFREGNVLHLPSQTLSVVEACSGIRSLLSLTFLSLVYAYFFDNRVWMRWALLAATIPIAIIANAGRVTITGLLSEYNPALVHGFAHSAEGWIIFMVALICLVMVHKLIDRFTRRHNG